MSSPHIDDHRSLLTQGLEIYERRQYREALPYLIRSLRLEPNCPVAGYNVLNCLYQLERLSAAETFIYDLHGRSDESLSAGCEHMDWPVEEFRADLAFLSFLVLHVTHDGWVPAGDFLVRHLKARIAGVESIFAWDHVQEEANEFLAELGSENQELLALIRAAEPMEQDPFWAALEHRVSRELSDGLWCDGLVPEVEDPDKDSVIRGSAWLANHSSQWRWDLLVYASRTPTVEDLPREDQEGWLNVDVDRQCLEVDLRPLQG